MVLALIGSAGEKEILDRANQLLNQQDSSLKDVRETLQEYHLNVSEDDSGKMTKIILENLLNILDQILDAKAPVVEDEKLPF